MPSKTERLLAHTLLQTTVSGETPDFVVDDGEGGLVVCGGEVLRCDGETDGVGYALTEGTSRGLYEGCEWESDE